MLRTDEWNQGYADGVQRSLQVMNDEIIRQEQKQDLDQGEF